jgi:hypothetical protein
LEVMEEDNSSHWLAGAKASRLSREVPTDSGVADLHHSTEPGQVFLIHLLAPEQFAVVE